MPKLPTNMPDWMKDHIQLYLTDPEAAHMFDSSAAGATGKYPTLLLITQGHRSGEQRFVPLVYKKVGDAYAITASNAGAPNHPAWYLNLQAKPECEIKVGKLDLSVRAREAGENERKELWEQLAEVFPGYNEYQKTAGKRVIPVVVLEPR